MTTKDQTEASSQPSFFEAYESLLADADPDELLAELYGYEEPPMLLVDTDPERAVRRQKELMDTVFGGIGEERKPEKRMGLALQQLDVEQRHALRLLLIYEEAEELVAHLQRCLDDPAYGYGPDGRGDNGRTVAQGMAAVAGDDLPGLVADWLILHRDFQQRVLGGRPFSFRSLFDYADLDSFTPLVQRVGETTWRLGVEGEGKYRKFQGDIARAWPQICDTYVEWSDADNETWLTRLKRQAARTPDSIFRAARADRLRKESYRLEVEGSRITLLTERSGPDWPRAIIMVDEAGTGMLGLSRLSGHSFYEISWEGGLHSRRFEISGLTRQGVRFEHIEYAALLAETLGAEYGLRPEGTTPAAVEAAYLRRLKATSAEIGPPRPVELPRGVEGRPAALYRVNDLAVTLLYGGPDIAYAANPAGPERGVLLCRDEARGVIRAQPVVRGRPRRGLPLMTTPLAELAAADAAQVNRALAAWAAWLTQAVK